MSPETIIHNLEHRQWWKIALERFMYALLTSFCVLALIISTSILYNYYFNSPPVEITSLNNPPSYPLCPGDRFDIHYRMKIKSPFFTYLYVSVMDAGLTSNIHGTQQEYLPTPQPVDAVIEDILPWTTPSLPPGGYNRVLTLRGYRTNERPVFSIVPFTVGEDCDD